MKKYLGLLLLLLVPFIVKAEDLYFKANMIEVGDIYLNGDQFYYDGDTYYYDAMKYELNIKYYNDNTLLGSQIVNASNPRINGPIYDSWIVTYASFDEDTMKADINLKRYIKPDDVHIYNLRDIFSWDNGIHNYILYPGDIIRGNFIYEHVSSISPNFNYVYYENNEKKYELILDHDPNYYNGGTELNTIVIGYNPYTNTNVRTEGPYYTYFEYKGSAGVDMYLEHYELPEIIIQCDKQTLKKGETSKCSLYYKTNYINDSINMKLDSETLNINNLTSLFDFESSANSNFHVYGTDDEAILRIFDQHYISGSTMELKIFEFEVELKDEYEEIDNLVISAASEKNFVNERDITGYYVLNKTNDFVEPEIKGVEVENPKTGVDNTFKQSLFIIACVVLFIVFVLVDKKKVFKKI